MQGAELEQWPSVRTDSERCGDWSVPVPTGIGDSEPNPGADVAGVASGLREVLRTERITRGREASSSAPAVPVRPVSLKLAVRLGQLPTAADDREPEVGAFQLACQSHDPIEGACTLDCALPSATSSDCPWNAGYVLVTLTPPLWSTRPPPNRNMPVASMPVPSNASPSSAPARACRREPETAHTSLHAAGVRSHTTGDRIQGEDEVRHKRYLVRSMRNPRTTHDARCTHDAAAFA